MVALLPRADYAVRMAVAGGDPVDELHLTLAYVADIADSSPHLAGLVAKFASVTSPVYAEVFAHAVFNPHRDDPCAVHLIGQSSRLAPMRAEVAAWTGVWQREPYIPHITGRYDTSSLDGLSYTGPVVFDRIRLAMGDDVQDFPLLGSNEEETAVISSVHQLRSAIEAFASVPTALKGGERARIVAGAHHLGAAEEVPDDWSPSGHKALDVLIEVKAASQDPRARRLRRYWATGAGRARWRPGTPGAFRRLRRLLSQHVKNPRILNGLTANIYRQATGEWPGRRSSKVATISVDEMKAAMLLADPDADLANLDLFDAESLDEDDIDDELDDDDMDDAYERAIVEEFEVSLEGDHLVRDDDDDRDDDDRVDGNGIPSLF